MPTCCAHLLLSSPPGACLRHSTGGEEEGGAVLPSVPFRSGALNWEPQKKGALCSSAPLNPHHPSFPSPLPFRLFGEHIQTEMVSLANGQGARHHRRPGPAVCSEPLVLLQTPSAPSPSSPSLSPGGCLQGGGGDSYKYSPSECQPLGCVPVSLRMSFLPVALEPGVPKGQPASLRPQRLLGSVICHY